ncbi:FkbM family methyltransferase [Massilia forsythiae]|uniref:FkbM family methyltransferase n=1 Tax=Massilia forsythiae TaxID=2728020 RepID=A0A7Z2VX49_9BURK|nr:FkbM family methyltransferase [Massilia forsythiae]QJE00705.1 FkbM family methyltransferase [Massilia forsythiae]
MTFLSYSQNNEDVLLWRALGHVKPEDGFYIDVGASDPVEHSVTKAFYDAGWRGINIEPLPAHIAAFDEQRPRDVNLAVAAGSSEGSLTLYDVPAVRGWASPEAAVAELHRAEGHAVAELAVPVRTLAAICGEHVRGAIHFLKIDVEGFEGEVLRGMDFERWRPWVLVIEATVPNSRETNHEAWEELVTGQRYRYAWFDGLNRYYVAQERPELLQHFGIQPNVFDDFISYHLDRAWSANRDATRSLREYEQQAAAMRGELHDLARHAEAKELEKQDMLARFDLEKQDMLARLDQLGQDLAAAHASGRETAEWAGDLERRLVAVLNSSSWRITAPLRFVMRRGPDSMAGIARRKAKGAARRSLRWLTSRETLRRTVLPLAMRSPRLQAWMARTLAAAKQATADGPAPAVAVPYALRELPQSAREALDQLRQAYASQKK